MVVGRKAEGSINRVVKPRVAIYACPLDTQQSDTKGTVLLKTAKELMNYTKSEEEHAEKVIRSIADSGNLIDYCFGIQKNDIGNTVSAYIFFVVSPIYV